MTPSPRTEGTYDWQHLACKSAPFATGSCCGQVGECRCAGAAAGEGQGGAAQRAESPPAIGCAEVLTSARPRSGASQPPDHQRASALTLVSRLARGLEGMPPSSRQRRQPPDSEPPGCTLMARHAPGGWVVERVHISSRPASVARRTRRHTSRGLPPSKEIPADVRNLDLAAGVLPDDRRLT